MDPRAQRAIRQRILPLATVLVSIILAATTALLQSIYSKEPEAYHTSVLTGDAWVIELLTGHPGRIRCELGVHRHVFLELISALRGMGHSSSRFVSLEEQLAIFLYASVTGLTVRHIGERFQRSNETISRYFRKMLEIFSSPPFYTTYIRLPTAQDPTLPEICNNPKFWPFFKDALGAIDGSHIHLAPPAIDRPSYRNRKGFCSQNCLFGCSFSLLFIYTLTGWEGSATDARIFDDACLHDFQVPAGKYYLADAGYPLCDKLLVPYRGVRYHLAEWGRANTRPKNMHELFNLRHASARNVIERIFGVLKRRFRILLLAPEYDLIIQAKIPAALCAIHNFIRMNDADEGGLPEERNLHDQDHNIFDHGVFVGENPEEDNIEMARLRDQIAWSMWEDYQQILIERGMVQGPSDEWSDEGLLDEELPDDNDNENHL